MSVDKDSIQRGHVIAAPDQGKAEIYAKDEADDSLMFFFGTADVTGIVNLPDGVEMVMPDDNLSVEVELGKAIAMEEGQRFAIRKAVARSVLVALPPLWSSFLAVLPYISACAHRPHLN